MADTLFHTAPLPTNDGWTWTLTTRLGDALVHAEQLFGPRQHEWTILGVELADSDQPQIWYPGNRKHVAIQLGRSAHNNMSQALYHLAHEVVHCLSPTGQAHTTVLEEGIATWFAGRYLAMQGQPLWKPTLTNYRDAMLLVDQLMSADPTCVTRARLQEPVIGKISRDHLLTASPALDTVLVDKLVQPFAY